MKEAINSPAGVGCSNRLQHVSPARKLKSFITSKRVLPARLISSSGDNKRLGGAESRPMSAARSAEKIDHLAVGGSGADLIAPDGGWRRGQQPDNKKLLSSGPGIEWSWWASVVDDRSH